MNINEKLLKIQTELKAPKGQKNKFGNYMYRSCEDILEAVKPLLKENKVTLQLTDEIVFLGDRYYIKATAVLKDTEEESKIENSAYARESETKKGMDDSQITGTASSYARKYALNGLFCIDDTKDADTNEYKNQQKDTKITKTMEKALRELISNNNIANQRVLQVLNDFGYEKLAQIKVEDLKDIQEELVGVLNDRNSK